MTADDEQNPWGFADGFGGDPAGQASGRTARVIEGLSPLDDQFGVTPPRPVPDGVQDWLYDGVGGSYALIDGAKVPNLPDLLGTSGMAHASLYAPGLEDVAPWLVQLDPGNALARHLWTKGRAPWYLWPAEAAIFLRSAAPLGDLRAHLRRYTQVQDESGARVYFRFWEPGILWRYLRTHSAPATGHVTGFLGPDTWLVPDVAGARLMVFAPADHAERRGPDGNWPMLSADLGQIRLDLFHQRLDADLTRRLPPFAKVPPDQRAVMVPQMAGDAMRLGLLEERSITRYCLTYLTLGRSPEVDPRFQALLGSRQHGLDRSRKMLKLALSIAKG